VLPNNTACRSKMQSPWRLYRSENLPEFSCHWALCIDCHSIKWWKLHVELGNRCFSSEKAPHEHENSSSHTGYIRGKLGYLKWDLNPQPGPMLLTKPLQQHNRLGVLYQCWESVTLSECENSIYYTSVKRVLHWVSMRNHYYTSVERVLYRVSMRSQYIIPVLRECYTEWAWEIIIIPVLRECYTEKST